MPLQVGELYAEINVDQKKFEAGLKSAESKFKGLGDKFNAMSGTFTNIGTRMSLGLTAPIAGAAGASIKLASDYQESLNKINVAFQENAGQVESWSQNSLKQFGLAKGTALDMAAGFGDMATSMGFSTKDAADMSSVLVGRAADLSSFKNKSIDEMNTALNAIFTGETESLKMIGVVMTQANLADFAVSKGMKKKITDMTQAELVALRYQFVMEKTANAENDFAETGAGAAGQMRTFGESLKELGQSIGDILLPAFIPILTGINDMIKAFGNMSPAGKKIVVTLALLVAAVGPLLMGLGMVAGGITAISAALPILGGAFAAIAGAIGWPVVVIGGLIAAGILLIKNWDKVKAFGISMWDAIKVQWNNSAVILKNAMREAGQGIIEVWGKIKGAILEAVAAALRFAGATEKAAAVQYEADKAQYIGLANNSSQGGRRGNQSLFGYASGTSSARPGLAWVGERGPELVNFRGGESVLSNRDSMGLMGGTVNHTGTIRVEGVNSMGQLMGATELIASELSKEMRRWPSKTAALPSRA